MMLWGEILSWSLMGGSQRVKKLFDIYYLGGTHSSPIFVKVYSFVISVIEVQLNYEI